MMTNVLSWCMVNPLPVGALLAAIFYVLLFGIAHLLENRLFLAFALVAMLFCALQYAFSESASQAEARAAFYSQTVNSKSPKVALEPKAVERDRFSSLNLKPEERGALAEEEGRAMLQVLDVARIMSSSLTGKFNITDGAGIAALRQARPDLHVALTAAAYEQWDRTPSGPGVHVRLLHWARECLRLTTLPWYAQSWRDIASLANPVNLWSGASTASKLEMGRSLVRALEGECALWGKQRIGGKFYFVKETDRGTSLLVGSDKRHVYEVYGITSSLGDLLRLNGSSAMPITVHLTLLPFNGKLVFDGGAITEPWRGSESLPAKLLAVVDQALQAGTVITSKSPAPSSAIVCGRSGQATAKPALAEAAAAAACAAGERAVAEVLSAAGSRGGSMASGSAGQRQRPKKGRSEHA